MPDELILVSKRGKDLIQYIDGILPKGAYPPDLSMADRALLAGYPLDIQIIILLT